MPRLTNLKPRVKQPGSRIRNSTTRDHRMTGEKLQRLRLRMWTENPYCAEETCGKLTQFPYGFHIDHTVPLEQGGKDCDANRQLLCIECHDKKTKAEAKLRSGGGLY